MGARLFPGVCPVQYSPDHLLEIDSTASEHRAIAGYLAFDFQEFNFYLTEKVRTWLRFNSAIKKFPTVQKEQASR
jgi:hypothetical protein